uniref:Ribosomal protein S2 n=1 Tax=Jakoba libera TaxID=143017 RepID=M4QCF1_JAKLI|nr:ribosomal protein S2 [Jakoba libera]AGH24229.1 ribosomal protein S2 [Jakoba libera]
MIPSRKLRIYDTEFLNELMGHEIHLGLSKTNVHPLMIKYIQGYRNEISVYRMELLIESFRIFTNLVKQFSKDDCILFITKKREISNSIKKLAIDHHQYYMLGKWIPGLLTNFATYSKDILNLYTKKQKNRKRVLTNTLGISSMSKLPSLIIIIGLEGNSTAIREAHKLNIPIVGFTSSREDPKKVTYCIPSNLSSSKSMHFYLKLLQLSFK